MSNDPKYRNSARRDLSAGQWRRLGLLIGLLILLVILVVIVAVLVAFGEITLG